MFTATRETLQPLACVWMHRHDQETYEGAMLKLENSPSREYLTDLKVLENIECTI